MTLENSLRKTRRKRGGVDFQKGDKVKFSPKMREDLTGVRSERALNWMEKWTGTVESVNDVKPKKAVQVYWKTGGGSEAWTSNPKEHLIKLSGSQTGSGRKLKTRRRRRKKRGGVNNPPDIRGPRGWPRNLPRDVQLMLNDMRHRNQGAAPIAWLYMNLYNIRNWLKELKEECCGGAFPSQFNNSIEDLTRQFRNLKRQVDILSRGGKLQALPHGGGRKKIRKKRGGQYEGEISYLKAQVDFLKIRISKLEVNFKNFKNERDFMAQVASQGVNKVGGLRRKRHKKRRKTRRKRGGNYLGFSIGDQVVLSNAGLARIASGPPFAPGIIGLSWITPAYRDNAPNWVGFVTAAVPEGGLGVRGMVMVRWNTAAGLGVPPSLSVFPYKDYEADFVRGVLPPVGGRSGPVGDIRLLNPPERLQEAGINSNQPGGKRCKTRRKLRKKRRRTRRKRRRKIQQSRRKKQRGGNPQKDLHDAIKENHEMGVIQALHNGAEVNKPRDYQKMKPFETDSPEGRICTGKGVMRRGKQTPLMHAVQRNTMAGIVEHILGDKVGQEPGINLDFKDPYYQPPKTALEIAHDLHGNDHVIVDRINVRKAADTGIQLKEKYEQGEVFV